MNSPVLRGVLFFAAVIIAVVLYACLLYTSRCV